MVREKCADRTSQPHLENVRLWVFLLINRMVAITVMKKGMWALWDWGSMTLSLSTLWLPFLWHRRNLFNMVCNMWKGSRQGHGRVILIIVMYLNDKLPVKSKSLYTALKIKLASVFNFTLWTGTVTMLVRSGTNTTATGQKVKGSPAYRACFSNLDQALKILTPIDFTVPCLKTYTYEKSSMHING